MRRLFARAGVDYVQWRALMRAYYLIDVGPLLGAHGSKETLLAVARLLLAILFYAFLGGGAAVLVLAARDPLVGAVAMTTTTMWLTAMSVLFQSSSLILPDDYALLGFQPLTSRTYLAVRAGALIAQSLQTAALAGWVPVLAFLLRPDASWRFAFAAVLAVAGSALAATLAVVVLCSSLLLVLPARRLQRAISYAQIGSLLGLTAGYSFVWMSLVAGGRGAVAAHVDFAFPRHAALLAMPPTWFGSYVAIAGGSAGGYELAAALLSAASLLLLALSLGGRLSAGYAVRVAQLATASAEQASPPRWTPAFLRGERRAMGLLLAGQLRGDQAT